MSRKMYSQKSNYSHFLGHNSTDIFMLETKHERFLFAIPSLHGNLRPAEWFNILLRYDNKKAQWLENKGIGWGRQQAAHRRIFSGGISRTETSKVFSSYEIYVYVLVVWDDI